MKPIGFAPAARDEFDEAAEWYESHAEGLGQRFVDCVDATVQRIAALPGGFPTWDVDPRFKRAVVPRFPYLLFYRELAANVEIVAVAHGAREPGYWLGRK
jgi:plasmid stabilization system protein ParE